MIYHATNVHSAQHIVVFCIVLQLFSVGLCHPRATHTAECWDPPDIDIFNNYYGLHETYLQVDPRNSNASRTGAPHASTMQYSASEHGDCVEYVMSNNLHFIGERDFNPTCPWHYELNHDENRRPATIVEAKCNCNGTCLHGGPGSRCVEVLYYIPFNRKTGSCDERTNTNTYTPVVEAVVVGCTCEHPRLHGHHRLPDYEAGE